MLIKLLVYGFLIYFVMKIFRFIRVVSSSNISKKRENPPPQKSYNEKDVIDVDFKEIKDEKETAGSDQQ